jgi:uncharacterized protein (UPF0332 family)
MASAGVFFAKSEESLVSSEADFVANRFNRCARGSYYAAFQAAIAALIAEQILARGKWGHDFVQSEFGGRLVYRRKTYEAGFRALLPAAMRLRADADYTESRIHRRDIAPVLEEVRRLVAAVRRNVNGGG